MGDQSPSAFMYAPCAHCAGLTNCFVSVGNRLATKHLRISVNLTHKYELTYHCLLVTLA